jgi:hypothetical protein
MRELPPKSNIKVLEKPKRFFSTLLPEKAYDQD